MSKTTRSNSKVPANKTDATTKTESKVIPMPTTEQNPRVQIKLTKLGKITLGVLSGLGLLTVGYVVGGKVADKAWNDALDQIVAEKKEEIEKESAEPAEGTVE